MDYILDEGFILIDTIKKAKLRKQSAEKFEILDRKNRTEIKKEGTSKPSPRKGCFVIKTTRTI